MEKGGRKATAIVNNEERTRLGILAGQVFRPSAPIDEQALFAGRTDQLRRVADAINQPGRHVIIFGERGVGKTSLVSVLSRVFSLGDDDDRFILMPRVNCETGESYASLWRKVFSSIDVHTEARQVGFHAEDSGRGEIVAMSDKYPDEISSNDVQHALSVLIAGRAIPAIIMDEFDRIESPTTRRLVADTVKMLSDQGIGATLILVGVADSVNDLIQQHESVERNLVQIQMPRMSRGELREIMSKGFERLDMRIDDDACSLISLLSQGLPSYTHLLGQHSARAAIDAGLKTVTMDHVSSAIKTALADAEQTIRSEYDKATASPRENLFPQVLLACALARRGELGYFTAADVREPLRQITNRDLDIPSFARHLKEFCEEIRGPILQRSGAKHRIRYRFIKPLMQPYVILKGLASGLVEQNVLETLDQEEGLRL